jgi:anhydro-N-acetylmuramic acid kinase
MLIDALVAHFTNGRQRYDKNAAIAQAGRAIPALLDELMQDPYLKQPPPKSTGREYYGRAYLQKVLALARRHRAKPADLIRAATIFTALSVVDALNRFVLPRHKIHQLIVSGGGARNPLILAQLSALLGAQHVYPEPRRVAPHPGKLQPSSKIKLFPSSELGIPTDAKEAFAFALLAYETFHRRPSSLPSATGARGPAILGKISYAPPR